VKIYVTRKDPDGLSVMQPLQYMKRFQTKMDQIFELNEGDDIEANIKSPLKTSLSASSLSVSPKVDTNTTLTINPLSKPYNPYTDINVSNSTQTNNSTNEVKSSIPTLTNLFPSVSGTQNDNTFLTNNNATAFDDDDDDDLDENLVLI
jgi:flagellar biosynthesis/type III secretory pathway M-ring protein FliF/YscJ